MIMMKMMMILNNDNDNDNDTDNDNDNDTDNDNIRILLMIKITILNSNNNNDDDNMMLMIIMIIIIIIMLIIILIKNDNKNNDDDDNDIFDVSLFVTGGGVVDGIPPLLFNCPNAVFGQLISSSGLASVSWDLPFATDDGVAIDFTSGLSFTSAFFPEGRTGPFSWRFSDAVGNEVTCELYVFAAGKDVLNVNNNNNNNNDSENL